EFTPSDLCSGAFPTKAMHNYLRRQQGENTDRNRISTSASERGLETFLSTLDHTDRMLLNGSSNSVPLWVVFKRDEAGKWLCVKGQQGLGNVQLELKTLLNYLAKNGYVEFVDILTPHRADVIEEVEDLLPLL